MNIDKSKLLEILQELKTNAKRDYEKCGTKSETKYIQGQYHAFVNVIAVIEHSSILNK